MLSKTKNIQFITSKKKNSPHPVNSYDLIFLYTGESVSDIGH